MECPTGASGITFPHFLSVPVDISGREDSQEENREGTRRGSGSGERTRHEDKGGYSGFSWRERRRKGGCRAARP
ncbi:hypothetical protein NDU88_009310 [Pleurodeles waltl]|uniref:Uncharacterized protein n=1 Tax=Pleurodeles waltl TaxID=8319 RepID=A0AAV7PS41_PLEWA|nr:hypothetical protein NDU88_009310 [Pleurodeles waltl]